MARPGKAVFDAGMMAGWALVAVLAGLVALTVVDDPGSRENSTVVAALENDNARLITGSIDRDEPGTASISKPKSKTALDPSLLEAQNKSFNPFSATEKEQQAQIQKMMQQISKLQREVQAFHTSTGKLRRENQLLQHRLSRIELGDGQSSMPVRSKDRSAKAGVGMEVLSRDPAPVQSGSKKQTVSVRVIDLSGKKVPLPVAPPEGKGQADVDVMATGSIPSSRDLGTTTPPSGGFDPFAKRSSSQIQTSVQPLDMDVNAQITGVPRPKPVQNSTQQTNSEVLRPQSEVIAAPIQIRRASQTSFGLDLGQFRSLSELASAWKEVSISQRSLLGDLKPLSYVSQGANRQLALNLLAGPIQNAAQAAILCANLQSNGYACKVSPYTGLAVALK